MSHKTPRCSLYPRAGQDSPRGLRFWEAHKLQSLPTSARGLAMGGDVIGSTAARLRGTTAIEADKSCPPPLPVPCTVVQDMT